MDSNMDKFAPYNNNNEKWGDSRQQEISLLGWIVNMLELE